MTDHPASFTPGPWEIYNGQHREKPPLEYSKICIVDQDGKVVAVAYGWTLEEAQHNAHGIKALPDIYAALEELVEIVESLVEGTANLNDIDNLTTRPGNEALAKARPD